jgi:hypothetical protein
MLDAPAAIEGYTAVTAPADLAPGSYYVLLGGAGFNYVVIVGADGPITAAPPPPPAAPDVPVVDEPVVEAPVVAAAEVYITIVNNGQVEVAAQPIIPDEMTIEGVLLKAHETWYKDGVSGYSAGIDPTFNMYLIESAWGVTGVPFISQGEAMMGSTPVNAVAVAPGDNIIMTTTGAAMAVTLTATAGETDSEIVVTAKSQTFDISTYGYMAGKLSGARVIDSAGNELGTTDSDGVIVITLPEGDELEAWDGVVIVEGAAAINVKASISEPNVIDPDARKVYVSVSLDGVLAYAAETVTVTNSDELGEQRTIEGVIKVAHEMFYSGGVDGYGPNLFWGVAWDSSDTTKANRPKIALNDRLIDLSDPAALQTTVRSDDNILFSIATNPQATPRAIWITCYINGIIAYGEAYELTEGPDGTVIKTPIVDAALVDGTTGPGTAPVPLTDPNLSVMDENNTGVRTDENGHFEVNTPTSGRIGIIAIEGYAAMNTIYSADYPLFKGPDGRSMLFLLVIAVIALIPLLSIVLHAQSTEIKNRGVKFSKSALGGKLGGSKLK